MIPSWTHIRDALEGGCVALEKIEGMIFARRLQRFYPLLGTDAQGFEDLTARCMSEFAAADGLLRDVMPGAVVYLSQNSEGWSVELALDPASLPVRLSARSAPLAMTKAAIEALAAAENRQEDDPRSVTEMTTQEG